MSATESPSVGQPARVDEEDGVVRYLVREPEFLHRHPELLEVLRVPHDCGGAASLIEAQVQVLRRRCAELDGRLTELVGNARSNEELGRRVHRLSLALMESTSLDEIFATLYQGLEEGFGAGVVSLRLYARAAAAQDRGLAELCGDGPQAASEAALFAELWATGQPRCGAPDPEQAGVLFGERAAQLESVAVLPLVLGEARGVLALGDASAGRYNASMGTLYLRQLAEVLGVLISRHVR